MNSDLYLKYKRFVKAQVESLLRVTSELYCKISDGKYSTTLELEYSIFIKFFNTSTPFDTVYSIVHRLTTRL